VDGHEDLAPLVRRLRAAVAQCPPLQHDHTLHRLLQPLEVGLDFSLSFGLSLSL
jgi:hypothetical protein